MSKAVEARVLSYYDNPNALNIEITALIEQGWQPEGGASVCECDRQGGGRTLLFSQTMIKYRNADCSMAGGCINCAGNHTMYECPCPIRDELRKVDGQKLTECDRISFSDKQTDCSPEPKVIIDPKLSSTLD